MFAHQLRAQNTASRKRKGKREGKGKGLGLGLSIIDLWSSLLPFFICLLSFRLFSLPSPLLYSFHLLLRVLSSLLRPLSSFSLKSWEELELFV